MNSKILSNPIGITMQVYFTEEQCKKISDYDCICENLMPVIVGDLVIEVIKNSELIENDDGELIGFDLYLLIWSKYIDKIGSRNFGFELEVNDLSNEINVISVYSN